MDNDEWVGLPTLQLMEFENSLLILQKSQTGFVALLIKHRGKESITDPKTYVLKSLELTNSTSAITKKSQDWLESI